ncbi:hypothetical protein NCCP2145_26290 [Pseudarthrobacter sp. NCCP-2145]|nr:hypothetical protein GCM10017547_06710 [Pseudarthrobacter oxydans]GKV73248.1 hypothetical protein NCCP2145_26290 [Pseudarthrobacter sp. NCCP-2145]
MCALFSVWDWILVSIRWINLPGGKSFTNPFETVSRDCCRGNRQAGWVGGETAGRLGWQAGWAGLRDYDGAAATGRRILPSPA